MSQFFKCHKNGKKSLRFLEQDIIKNKFFDYETSISIDTIDIKKQCCLKKIYMAIKVHINIILGIYVKAVLFCHHYA